jgi:protein phosphatase
MLAAFFCLKNDGEKKDNIAIILIVWVGRPEPLIMPKIIQVPRRTLLVLCGPAGSGKSTFAAQHFIPTNIVSSDYCRAMICDDVNNQQVNRDTFDLFYYIIQKRMFLGRFTVADSTALQSEARRKLRELSRRSGYLGCLLIFNIPPEICLERDKMRQRIVGEQVVAYHAGLLQRTLQDAPQEGWEQVHVLGEEDMNAVIEILA